MASPQPTRVVIFVHGFRDFKALAGRFCHPPCHAWSAPASSCSLSISSMDMKLSRPPSQSGRSAGISAASGPCCGAASLGGSGSAASRRPAPNVSEGRIPTFAESVAERRDSAECRHSRVKRPTNATGGELPVRCPRWHGRTGRSVWGRCGRERTGVSSSIRPADPHHALTIVSLRNANLISRRLPPSGDRLGRERHADVHVGPFWNLGANSSVWTQTRSARRKLRA